jgi:hypothetical protein
VTFIKERKMGTSKAIKNIYNNGLFYVESEPGDMTRYSYFVYRDGPDVFRFMPCKNDFPYPQTINYWDIEQQKDGKYLTGKNNENVNPWTIRECVSTILFLRGEVEL